MVNAPHLLAGTDYYNAQIIIIHHAKCCFLTTVHYTKCQMSNSIQNKN